MALATFTLQFQAKDKKRGLSADEIAQVYSSFEAQIDSDRDCWGPEVKIKYRVGFRGQLLELTGTFLYLALT